MVMNDAKGPTVSNVGDPSDVHGAVKYVHHRQVYR